MQKQTLILLGPTIKPLYKLVYKTPKELELYKFMQFDLIILFMNIKKINYTYYYTYFNIIKIVEWETAVELVNKNQANIYVLIKI